MNTSGCNRCHRNVRVSFFSESFVEVNSLWIEERDVFHENPVDKY